MMRFPDTPQSPDVILQRLERMRSDDADWRSGRTWSLVYSAGPDHDELVGEAYRMYANENGLSPAAFPSLERMEREVVWAVQDLLRADPERAGGTMASGGTESILLAMKAYRDRAGIRAPSIVVPATAHPAFVKAANLLGMDARVIPVGDDLVADVGAMSDAIDDTTVAIGASAPAFPYGLVDPIPELGDIAAGHGIGLHVDACLGGFALPFLRRAGLDVPEFDFTVAGVSSISSDLHKYGYGPKGTSAVVYADRRLRRHQFTAYADWPGGALVSPTLLGTRPGGGIAAAWAAIHHFGLRGYEELFEGLMDVANRLKAGIEEIGDLRVLGEPPMSVFAFTSSEKDIFDVADRLELRGWRIDRQKAPDSLHLIVNPTHAGHVAEFLDDLKAAFSEAADHDPHADRPVIYGVTSRIDVDGDIHGTLLDQIERRYDEA